MSSKMTCPGCGAYTSGVLAAWEEGRACPYCGLSHGAMAEIDAVQRSLADGKLKEQLADAIKRREVAEAQAVRLERKLERVKRALD